MATSDDISIIEDGDSAAVLDNRYHPIVITAWLGTPTMVTAEEYFNVRKRITDKADAEDSKVVVVADLSAMGAPPATIRKRLGELSRGDADIPSLHQYIVVVTNPLLRGVVTALSWIAGDRTKGVQYAGSLEEAINKASKALERLGVSTPPIDAASYELPRPG